MIPLLRACTQLIDRFCPSVLRHSENFALCICRLAAFVVHVDRGMLMTCGSGTHGSLGHGNYNDVLDARVVEALIGFQVEQVCVVT